MAAPTIRDVDDITHQARGVRAAEHGRSAEEKVCHISGEGTDPILARRNSASPAETAAAVDRLQNLFAALQSHYSVDQFVAEKHMKVALERAVEELSK